MLIWDLGSCINLQKKDKKIMLILLIADTVRRRENGNRQLNE